jgi:photosystem II stability/assembly factor-like uncharacterized protein
MLRTIFILSCLCWISSAQAHWRAQPSGAAQQLRAISGGSARLYIVGDHGTILSSPDGLSWSTQVSGSLSDLNAVFAIDSKHAIAVGDFGTILTTQDAGATWVAQPNDLYQNLHAIWGIKDTLYLAGADGLLLRSTNAGASWTKLKTSTQAKLQGIWGSSSTDLYVVGKETVLHSINSGQTWEQLDVGAIDDFNSIWGASAKEIYITQTEGKIYATQNAGQSWTRINTNREALYAILGDTTQKPLALSDEGILHSSDKGATWTLLKRTKAMHSGLLRGDGALYFVGGGEIVTFGPSTSAWSQTESGLAKSLRTLWGDSDGLFVSSYAGDLLYSKDGARWTKISDKDTPKIVSLWGADVRALFAVAADFALYLSTDQGKTWSKVKLPAEKKLRNVWGINGRIFLVGDSVFSSDNAGETWTERPLPIEKRGDYSLYVSAPELSCVWGSTKDEVYVVGASGVIFHSTNGGASWKKQDSKTSSELRAIWGSGRDDVYVVGDDGAFLHTNNQGNTWTLLSGLSPSSRETKDKEDLNSIWGSGKDDIYIGGNINSNGLILHSIDQGKTWSPLLLPSFVNKLWGASTSRVYALGQSGEILQTQKGSLWERRDYPKETHLNGIWQAPNGVIYAVGARGEIQTTNDKGKAWERQQSGVRLPLWDVWGMSDEEIFVSGEEGLILATKNGGKTWERPATGATEILFGLWGDRKSNLYAVGGRGLILCSKDKGKTWSKQASGTNQNLYALWGDGATLYAVGAGGTLLQTTNGGASWSKQASGTKEGLFGLWGVNQETVYVVGDNALLQTTNGGKTWSNSSSARKGLRDIWASAQEAYAVGVEGTILYTRDAGKTWSAQSTGTKEIVSDVLGLSDGSVLVAGDSLSAQDGGKAWTISSTSKQALYGLWSDGDELFSVGSFGTIQRNGAAEYSSKTQLLSVFGVSDSVYAVGYSLVAEGKNMSKPKGALLVNKKKAGWVAQKEFNWMPRDVWVNRAGTIYVVGESFVAPLPAREDERIKDDDKEDRKGALLTSLNGGKNWQETALDFLPRSVWGDTLGGLYLVGEKGTIWYRRDPSSSWETQSSKVTTTLKASWGDGATVYVVGEEGVILQSENAGKTWKRQRSYTNETLSSVWGDKDEVYAVGDAGVVLYSTDKGKTWEKQPSFFKREATAIWAGTGEVYTAGQHETSQGILLRLE